MDTIIEALRQVTLPTEADCGPGCDETALDPTDNVEWICTRFEDHDGPHVATYEQVSDADPRLNGTVIGLAWTD